MKALCQHHQSLFSSFRTIRSNRIAGLTFLQPQKPAQTLTDVMCDDESQGAQRAPRRLGRGTDELKTKWKDQQIRIVAGPASKKSFLLATYAIPLRRYFTLSCLSLPAITVIESYPTLQLKLPAEPEMMSRKSFVFV
jgi:hypothetical protein